MTAKAYLLYVWRVFWARIRHTLETGLIMLWTIAPKRLKPYLQTKGQARLNQLLDVASDADIERLKNARGAGFLALEKQLYIKYGMENE